MRNRQLRFASVVVLMTGLVSAVLAGRPAIAAPARQGNGFCSVEGQWCSFDGMGQLNCEISGQCESEGGEEEGDTGCTPGDQWATRTCEEDGLYECVYRCAEDGTSWEELGCAMAAPECEHDEWCYWDGETFEGGCWELPDNETPCEDMNWGAAGIQCMGEYNLSVSVSVPCQRVGRIPYPRGMVVVPNRLWITADSPAWNEAWSQTLDYNACLSHNIGDGDRAVRNYRIGLAWERMATPPIWEIENSGTYQGWEVRGVVWEQASWGKPRCGPSLTPGELLPSYRADVYSYWTAYWKIQYERQREGFECVWRQTAADNGECGCVPEGHDGQCSDDNDHNGISDWAGWMPEQVLCDDDENDDGIPDDHCWEMTDTGWTAFDLRQFGYPTSYFISLAAGPMPTTLEPNPGCSGICIPVIEVQGVISNPRGR